MCQDQSHKLLLVSNFSETFATFDIADYRADDEISKQHIPGALKPSTMCNVEAGEHVDFVERHDRMSKDNSMTMST